MAAAAARRKSVLPAATVLLMVSLQSVAGQTVTVGNRNVIVIQGVNGHDFSKVCTVDDESMVQEIQWLHGNEVVETAPPSEGHSIYSISNDDLTLAMSGEYFCRAKRTDDMFTDQVSAGTLTVLENGVIVAPNLQYAVLGTRVELQCDIEADEVNALDTWAVGEETDFSTGVNVIPSVAEGDEGRYTCRLNDPLELMDDFDIPIYLRITVPPVIYSDPDTLNQFTGDTFQDTLSVVYSGRSGDTSTVSWTKDGENPPFTGTDYKIQTTYSGFTATTSLIFTADYLSRSFEGLYSVIIFNSNDIIHESNKTATTSFTILVTVIPATITRVNITSRPPLSALIEWEVVYRHGDEHPDNITIFIEDRTTGAVSCHLVSSPAPQSAEVGVVPGAEYLVTLESANEDGRSSTPPVTFITDPTAPAVESVEVMRLDDSSFRLTARLHYTGGGHITHFNISFRVAGETEWNGAMMVPVELVPESDNLGWTGVVTSSQFAQYSVLEFRVLAVNDRHLISTNESPHREPLELPAAPVSIKTISTTTSSAVLEVELSQEGTPPLVAVLDLTSHPELGCCGNQTTYQRGGRVTFVLGGLSRDTTYTVSVFARNLAGQGPGTQQSFSTDGETMVLPLWQTVLIGVCGALVLLVLVVLFCVLVCCGCKASKKWGRKEYHTGGPIELANRELDRGNPMLTRSIRSNGYASSQVSFGSHHGRPMTPRTPTGLSVTSPSFEYTDAPKYDDLHTSRQSTSMSPFHASSREKLTHMSSASHGNLYYPTYPNDFSEEVGYQSLPRGMETAFPFGSITLSPPPAPAPCSTDV